MPYKVIGKNVYHYKGGRWSIKQHCRSKVNARRAVRFLRGLSHGMKPIKRR